MKKRSTPELKRRYEKLESKLAGTGMILQGTITERTIEKGKGQTYGPYYQWTFKQEGKTVTVNLTAEQAKIYNKAIDNNRKMEKTVSQMRELSEQILERETEGVKKRKSNK